MVLKLNYKIIAYAPKLGRICNDKVTGTIAIIFEMIRTIIGLRSENLRIIGFQRNLTKLTYIYSIKLALIYLIIIYFLFREKSALEKS